MKQSGFSLMELMVVMGIMTLITVMSFAGYPALRQKMSLKRTSEEVALIVRQAQAYSLGIKKPISGDYSGFGARFDKSLANQKSVVLFTDSDGKMDYDEGVGCGNAGVTECFQEFKINTKDVIEALQTCSASEVCVAISGNTLDIVYPRATSMATINNNSDASYAKITIKSPNGGAKNIKIWRSGQIEVE